MSLVPSFKLPNFKRKIQSLQELCLAYLLYENCWSVFIDNPFPFLCEPFKGTWDLILNRVRFLMYPDSDVKLSNEKLINHLNHITHDKPHPINPFQCANCNAPLFDNQSQLWRFLTEIEQIKPWYFLCNTNTMNHVITLPNGNMTFNYNNKLPKVMADIVDECVTFWPRLVVYENVCWVSLLHKYYPEKFDAYRLCTHSKYHQKEDTFDTNYISYSYEQIEVNKEVTHFCPNCYLQFFREYNPKQLTVLRDSLLEFKQYNVGKDPLKMRYFNPYKTLDINWVSSRLDDFHCDLMRATRYSAHGFKNWEFIGELMQDISEHEVLRSEEVGDYCLELFDKHVKAFSNVYRITLRDVLSLVRMKYDHNETIAHVNGNLALGECYIHSQKKYQFMMDQLTDNTLQYHISANIQRYYFNEHGASDDLVDSWITGMSKEMIVKYLLSWVNSCYSPLGGRNINQRVIDVIDCAKLAVHLELTATGNDVKKVAYGNKIARTNPLFCDEFLDEMLNEDGDL